MLKTTIVMTTQGRLTIPAGVRRELHLEGETHFEIEIRDGALVLRPAELIPGEDLWAYRPGHVRRVGQARAELRRAWGGR